MVAAARTELNKTPPENKPQRDDWAKRIDTYTALLSVASQLVEARISGLRYVNPQAAERLANLLNPKPRKRRPQSGGPRKGRGPPKRRPLHG